ncbi:MAG: hypothetical protein EZS28_018377 [Streblomastix strix]|uniref:Uncharacterized protein n=1 Tax=Streblomastix strix TaxID=222440 RepID=A0A5J4VV91_9EUKA|nr:MAG: hypothetical protein EZS28_018377 [Streblomastix strix]
MTRKSNSTSRQPPNRDSYWTPNYVNLIPQNQIQVAAQLQPTFVNAFGQNIEIDPLDPEQTMATPEEVRPSKHDTSDDGHDRTREPTEDTTFISNMTVIQQSDAEIVTRATQDRRSTSSISKRIADENHGLHGRTRSRSKETDNSTSDRFDQELIRDNATIMVSRSCKETNARSSTDCEFKPQSPYDKSRRNEATRIFERGKEYAIVNGKEMKRQRLDEAILETEAKKNKAVVVTASKYQKIGQGKEILQPHEWMEMKTSSRMINAQDK